MDTKFSKVIDVNANESISTIYNINGESKKGYVHSFSAGTLQGSFDNVTFTDISTDVDTSLEFNLTAVPFVRLTSNGKINIVFL